MSGCECKRDSAQPSTKGKNTMDTLNEILRALGRIEGELVEIRKLSERVTKLEAWQSWVRGGWAVLLLAYLYLWR
jgi:hypothetical protein